MTKELRLISKIILDKTGLIFPEKRISILDKNIQNRIRELELSDFSEYLNYLILYDKDSKEIRTLVNTLTINETFFFRHNDQFKTLKKIALSEIISRNLKTSRSSSVLKIWSAGCANGSETYSIAIVVKSMEKELNNAGINKIEILGTDIDSDMVHFAQKGVYSERCVTNEMPKKYLKKYFIKSGSNYMLNDDIKNMVTFKRSNLITEIYPYECDIIFCRNVLYYFDIKYKKEILRTFFNSLKENGYLFLGGTEVISLHEYFKLINHKDIIYYRKWTTDDIWYTDNYLKMIDRNQLKYYDPPSIKADVKTNTINFEGIFGENCDTDLLRQEILYSFSFIDKDTFENHLYFAPFKKLYFNFAKVRWISNNVLGEIKSIIHYLREKKFSITILLKKGQKITKAFKQAQFKNFCYISFDSDTYFIKTKSDKIKNKNKRKSQQKQRTLIITDTHSSQSSKNNELKRKDDINNIRTQYVPEKQKKSPLKEEKVFRNTFEVTDCNEKELEALKAMILQSLKTRKKLIIDFRDATYLNNEFYKIINKALKSADDKEHFVLLE